MFGVDVARRHVRLGAAALVLLSWGSAAVARQDPRREQARAAYVEAQQLLKKGGKAALPRAIERFQEAAGVWRDLGEPSWEAASLNGIGMARRAAGDGEQALEYFEKAIAVEHAIPDPQGEASVLLNYGATSNEMGRSQDAVDAYERALALFRIAGDRVDEVAACNAIRAVYEKLDDEALAGSAEERARQALSRTDAAYADVPRVKVTSTYRPNPEYPQGAREAGVSGSVAVRVVVGEDGRVIFAEAVRGHPLLRAASVAAARKARFEPPVKDGVPTKTVVMLSFTFSKR